MLHFDTRVMARWRLFAALGILLGSGCDRPPGAIAPQDAGLDAGADAGVDAGPLRRLVTRRLFGSTPVENGVVDPTFSTIDYASWSPYSYLTGMNALATPLHLPTPTGLPALRLIRTGTQASLTGLVRSAAGPVEVSLWCGQPEDAAATPRLSLLGLYPAGQGAADFDPDPETPPVTLGDITWIRYVAELAEGPLGWSSLRVLHQAQTPLYLNAPAFLPLGPNAGKIRKAGTSPRRLASVRPLTPEERDQWNHFFGRYRDRFGTFPP